MKTIKKHILNQEELHICSKKAKKRLKLLIFIFFLLIASTFLILLIKPSNIYIILLDVSESMSELMEGANGEEKKIDIAKESIIKFVENCSSNDYFLLATFGPGYCDGKGLEWIQSNPDKCGGEILISLSNDKLEVYDAISNIQSVKAETHLSEALFKVFNDIEKSFPFSLDVKKIEVLVIGDGQDHCHAIKPGDNVALLPWSFFNKLRLNTIAIQVADELASINLHTLASDGNGEYVNVYYADEFYNKIKAIAPKAPKWILYTHLAICFLIFILFLLILQV